jgi:hypothetical protein
MDFSSSRAANETFFELIPHPKDILKTANAAAEHTTEVVQATCNTIFDSAAAVNVELIAAGRSNVNATLEFARMAIALRSPLELSVFMNVCLRRQFELWIEQTRAFSNLAQRVEHVVACDGSGKAFKEAA